MRLSRVVVSAVVCQRTIKEEVREEVVNPWWRSPWGLALEFTLSRTSLQNERGRIRWWREESKKLIETKRLESLYTKRGVSFKLDVSVVRVVVAAEF